MKKEIIIIFLLLSLILLIKCDDEEESLNNEEEEFSELERNNYFKESLKEYLIEHNLFNNEKLIKKTDINKIFINVLTGQEKDTLPEEIVETFNKLSDYFINIYYEHKKEIRGKEFYDLVDMGAIFKKMEELFGDNPDDTIHDSQESTGL